MAAVVMAVKMLLAATAVMVAMAALGVAMDESR